MVQQHAHCTFHRRRRGKEETKKEAEGEEVAQKERKKERKKEEKESTVLSLSRSNFLTTGRSFFSLQSPLLFTLSQSDGQTDPQFQCTKQ